VANREFFPKGGALHATKDMKIHHKRTSRYLKELVPNKARESMDERQTNHKKSKILINMILLFETRPVTWEFHTYHLNFS
jgi:hypothetical protein